MNENLMIEEIKLKAFGSPTEFSSRWSAPEAAMPYLRKMIRRRMSYHYGLKEVQAVRLVNVDNEKKSIAGRGSKNRFEGKRLAGDNLAGVH